MRIVVDPIACEAHGLCAELLPEAITLDDWGYPVIGDGELPESLERLARRAASACPTLALRLRTRPVTASVHPAAREPERGAVSEPRRPRLVSPGGRG